MTHYINAKNENKVDEQLNILQKKTRVRNVSFYTLQDAISNLEHKLTNILYKKDWKGLKFEIDPFAAKFPASYRGKPESTQFTLERRRSDWFVNFRRDDCKLNIISELNIELKNDEIVDFLSTSNYYWLL